MSEPQFLFSEIPLSRAAFDRWLISVVPDAETWPVTAPPVQETTVGDALLSYFTAADDIGVLRRTAENSETLNFGS